MAKKLSKTQTDRAAQKSRLTAGLTPELKLPVQVSVLQYGEDYAVRVARHYLSQLAQLLAVATQEWEMTEDDLRQLQHQPATIVR